MSNQKIATILIPNYKTAELTKICLRLIRKFTDLAKVEVIVIDNNSNDESTKYLESVKWIKLIKRKTIPNEGGVLSHGRALDLGLKKVSTDYVISFHTDTFVHNDAWLEYLLSSFTHPKIAGVGSWKLEQKNFLQKLGKNTELLLKKLFGGKNNPFRYDKNYHYLRSHCAIYRTKYIKKIKTFFSDGNQTAGLIMHRKLINAGYKMIFLESNELMKYIHHVNHATQALNPEIKNRGSLKTLKTYFIFLKQPFIQSVLTKDDLDL
ncbi:MAG: glycosyltransferase [Nitrosomonadales bacterium]